MGFNSVFKGLNSIGLLGESGRYKY